MWLINLLIHLHSLSTCLGQTVQELQQWAGQRQTLPHSLVEKKQTLHQTVTAWSGQGWDAGGLGA